MTSQLVNRAELLVALESVAPALSAGDVLEQSASFVFKGGWVVTFDNEVYARTKTGMPNDLIGAVAGQPLLKAMRQLAPQGEAADAATDTIEVFVKDEKLHLRSGRNTIKVRIDPKILLPVDKVERPASDWFDLPEDFGEALKLGAESAGKDETKFINTCVNLGKKCVESTDNFQVAHTRLGTGLASTLIRSSSARILGAKMPLSVAESGRWLHFKCGGSLAYSVQRYSDEYYDLSPHLKLTGKPLVLPKALVNAIKIAEVFSGEYTSDNRVTVELRSGKLVLTGVGITGEFEYPTKVNYDGPAADFRIGPVTLAKMIERYAEMEVATVKVNDEEKTRLVVRSGRFYYMAVTHRPIQNGKVKNDPPKG